MANGGYYGEATFERLEQPLRAVDPVLEKFGARHGLALRRNYKDHPERSFEWHPRSVRCLIQLYLDSKEAASPTFTLWISTSQDREQQRFWKHESLFRQRPGAELGRDLETLLETGYHRLCEWAAAPHLLEFATELRQLQ